jgi:hypothetical protein
MPLLGSGGEFELHLHICRKWRGRSDLIAALESIQDSLGMIPLQPYFTKREGQTGRTVIEHSRFRLYCEDYYWISDSETHQFELHYQPPFVDRDLNFFSVSEGVDILFWAHKLRSGYSSLFFHAGIGSRIAPNGFEPIKVYAERLMQFYALLAQKLIPLLEPEYVWISEDDEYQSNPDEKDVMAHSLKVVYWANYFDPNYLSKEQETSFLNAPVGITKRLGKGIWYQLHERFEEADTEVVETIEAQAAHYFRALDIERVQWKFQSG